MFRNLFEHPAVLIVLVVLVVALFGAKRLPDAARGLGRSMRIFKSEVKEMKNDGNEQAATPKTAALDAETTSLEKKLAAEQVETHKAEAETPHPETRAS